MIHFSLKVVFFCMSIVNCAKCSALFAPKCSLRRSRGVRVCGLGGLHNERPVMCPRLHKCFQLPNSNFFNICDCTVSNSNLSKILDTLRCCHLLFA